MALTSLRASSPAGLPAVLRVLLVDRSPQTARSVRKALEREPGIRVHIARSPGMAVRLVENDHFDAVLVEEHLWNDGDTGLGKLVRDERPDIAVVLVTDDPSPAAGLGANARIARADLEAGHLLERIGSAIADTRGARRRETMVRWIERDARIDRVTGLFNRAAFNEQLRDACRASARNGAPVAIVAVSIETEAGGREDNGTLKDSTLRRAAAGMSRTVRSMDFAARAAESTLAVILPGSDLVLARRVARRMAQEVDRMNVEAWPEEPPVSLVFGVASGVGASAEELFGAAEANLRQPRHRARLAIGISDREERDGPSVA